MPRKRSRVPGKPLDVDVAPYIIECSSCEVKQGVDHYRKSHYSYLCPECGDKMALSDESPWDIKQDAKP